MSAQVSTAKISVFNSIHLSAPILDDNKIVTAESNEISLPASAGTLALQSEVEAVNVRVNNLVEYLKNWINNGNLNMSDIESAVDPQTL